MPGIRWARLRQDVNCGLRRGAWYRATRVGESDVVLQVNGCQRCYPLGQIELTTARPERWTIVTGVDDASVISNFWAKGYAVCPSCSHRQLLAGYPRSMRCDECDRRFRVDWKRL